jgi:CBS domain containing-hemolysin-like protein
MSSTLLYLIVPLLLILCGGFSSASETGIISIEKVKVLRAKREKKKWALRVSNFLAVPERFFSTILVSENFILVIASTLFAKFFIDAFGDNGAIIATILLSFFTLIIGQFIPKSIALANPEETMMFLSGLIHYIEVVAYPIVFFYAQTSKAIARLFTGDTKIDTIRRLDIVYAMSEYEKEASTLASRLFNFSRRTVGEVMIPLNAAFLCKKGTELETLSTSDRRIFTRIPVYVDNIDNIVGIFNIKDYFYTHKVLLRKPFFVNGNERCMSIFLVMKQRGEHMAIVRNNQNRVIGIVTLEDLIEELVGEIRDER